MIQNHQHDLGVRPLCLALGEPRSSWYRSLQPPKEATGHPRPHRSLSDEERRYVLSVLHTERFCDSAPAEIVSTLLDEGAYLCSERTMYRILEEQKEDVPRRQALPRSFARPELLATRPNELWSWDITKLKGSKRLLYYYLYHIMDVFSRYTVGWMVAYRESDDLAEDLIAEACLRQEIGQDQLTLHADRGSSMRSNKVAELLDGLGVTKTHSRPHVSNDNPYSESGFKTLKYRPDFPDTFGPIEEARVFCQQFFHWANNEHRHSGIAMLTPASVHYATYPDIISARRTTLHVAYAAHPERFVRGIPTVEDLPLQVWINKPIIATDATIKLLSSNH